MDILNTREQAIAIWLLIGLILVLFSSSIRGFIKEFFKILFVGTIIKVLFFITLYVFLCVLLLNSLGLWTADQSKDTVFWLFFVGFMTLGKVNEIKDDNSYFKAALKKNFKLTLFSEFLVNLYPFNLSVELIIVPLTVFVGALIAFSEKDPKHKQVHKLLTNFLVLFGLVILGYIIINIVGDPWGIINLNNLRGFLLAPLLSILFLPFLYVLSIYMFYEAQFVSLKFRLKYPELLHYAKRQSLLRFNINKDGVSRWIKRINTDTKSKTDIDNLINHIKEREAIERNPPIIDPSLGWSPFKAGNFLASEQLKSGYYDQIFENEWFSSAPYLKLGDKWSSNKISYYVNGNDKEAKRLELVLAVFIPEEANAFHDHFCSIGTILYEKALGEQAPPELYHALLNSKGLKINKRNILVKVRKESWGNSTNGYDVFFTLEYK